MAAGEGAMVEIMAMTSILALKVMMAVQVLVTMAATIKTIMMAMRTLLTCLIHWQARRQLQLWKGEQQAATLGGADSLPIFPLQALPTPLLHVQVVGAPSWPASWVPTQQVVWWASVRKDVWLQLR